jgi:hypothetical protein
MTSPIKPHSLCCDTSVHTNRKNPTRGQTVYYICDHCGDACDISPMWLDKVTQDAITPPTKDIMTEMFEDMGHKVVDVTPKLKVANPLGLDWEIEFDKLVATNSWGNHISPFMNYDWVMGKNHTGCDHDDGYLCSHRAKVIKDFIRQALASQRLEIVKMVDGMKMPVSDEMDVAENMTLDDVLEKLKTL